MGKVGNRSTAGHGLKRIVPCVKCGRDVVCGGRGENTANRGQPLCKRCREAQ